MEGPDSIDPYKAPAVNPEHGPDLDSPGQGWRVEQGRLLVRDHARLPDVCLLGGQTGAPGRRIFLNLWKPGLRVRVVAFCSDEGRRRVARRKMVIPAIAMLTFAGLEWCVLWRWSGVPMAFRGHACLLGGTFAGIVASFRAQRRDLRLARSEGVWHELSGVDPAAVEKLGRIVSSLNDQAEAP